MGILKLKEKIDEQYPRIFSSDGQDKRSSFALVRQLYADENFEDSRDPLTKVVSVVIPIHDATMLNNVAKRFGMSMSSFLSRFLDGVAQDSFFALDVDDRMALSKQADLDTLQFEKEKGFTSHFNYGYGDSVGFWESRAISINKKELEEIQLKLKDENNEPI